MNEFIVLRHEISPRIAEAFHAEHNRLYGYSLEGDTTAPVEIINVRVQAVGRADKPDFKAEEFNGNDPAHANKGERSVYVPETKEFQTVPIFDGHELKYGNHIEGPAMIESETTAIFVSALFNCVVDKLGSYAIYKKGREDLVASTLKGEA